jgi:hypothetical protein
LSGLRHGGPERAKGKVVVDPVGADDEHKEQGKKDHDAGDRDAAPLTGLVAHDELCFL